MQKFSGRSIGCLTVGSILTCAVSLESAASPLNSATGGWRDTTPWIVDAIKLNQGQSGELDWTAPGAPAKNDIDQLINARPVLSGTEFTFETEHFIIHYTNEGRDAATEEQVAWSADALEVTWNREINELGYPEPPADNGRGGDDRYDVYWTFQIGTYGYCSGETFVDENSMTSYLALANWMGEVETQVTVAHEFFHAIHFTMDALEETWWFEVTATWMEDLVYDDINDYYNYLDDPFDSPETPIDSATSIMYGHAIWGHSLSERYGADIIQDIWYRCSEASTANALSNNAYIIENNYSGSWPLIVQYFRESMFDLRRFEEGQGYAMAIGSDGQPGEVSMTQTVNSYPTEGEWEVDHTGGNFIEFLPDGDPGTLTIEYSGGTSLVASVSVQRANGTIDELITDTLIGNGATFTIEDFGGDISRAVMIVSHTGLSGTTLYTFSADAPSGGVGCSLAPIRGSSKSLVPLAGLMLAIVWKVSRRRRS